MKMSHLRSASVVVRAMLAACIIGVAGCAPSATSQTPPAAENTQQTLAADTPSPMSFIVNFRPSHALGQAQGLQNAGRYEEAARLVSVTLRDNTALRGLCFERFTVGGAEIVLNVCAPDPFEDPLVTQARWLEHLGATMGVAYVERNLVAQHQGAADIGPS